MLKLKQINKEYKTGELVQHALNNVSLNLRDNEFVAILGPSGSGKTAAQTQKTPQLHPFRRVISRFFHFYLLN